MLDVCLLGTGGMMPLPGRFLTSLMVRYNGSNLLIDCGEATQIAIKKKGWVFKPIDTICFTHYHADHISGLPGMLLTMGNAERTEPLTLIGPRGLERVVNALRCIAPELPFEIRYHELTEPEEHLEINGYHITAFKVQHNVICYGYVLEIPRGGKFDAPGRKLPISPCLTGADFRRAKRSPERMAGYLHRIWFLDRRERDLRLPILRIPDPFHLLRPMPQTVICLSAKECTENRKRRKKPENTST